MQLQLNYLKLSQETEITTHFPEILEEQWNMHCSWNPERKEQMHINMTWVQLSVFMKSVTETVQLLHIFSYMYS